MPKTNYSQLLLDALDVPRRELAERLRNAQGSRNIALQAKEIATHDDFAAELALQRAREVQDVSGAIYLRTSHAKLVAGNLLKFAEMATTSAATAAASMSTAATSVKSAANAVEALVNTRGGLPMLTKRNDAGDDIDKIGRQMADALDRALRSMNDLRSRSLESNVKAAQSLSSTVSQSLASVQSQIQEIDAEASASLDRARAMTTKAVEQHDKTSSFYFAQIAPFEAASQGSAAFQNVLSTVDKKTTGYIEATVVAGGTPKLKVTYSPPDKAANEESPETKGGAGKKDSVVELIVVAVEQKAAGQFKATSAIKHSQEAKPGKGGPLHWEITNDYTGAALAFGYFYSIFIIEQHKGENEDESSLRIQLPPSAPVLVKQTCAKRPGKPKVIPLEAHSFVVAFQAEEPAGIKWKEFRLLIVPKSVDVGNVEDAIFLSGRLNASSYVGFTPDQEIAECNANTVAAKVIADNRQDCEQVRLQIDADVWKQKEDKVVSEIKNKTWLAYFSPAAAASDQQPAEYKIASYTDVFGDPIDLTRQSYLAAVLYVPKDTGAEDDPTIEATALILSETTEISRIGSNAGSEPKATA